RSMALSATRPVYGTARGAVRLDRPPAAQPVARWGRTDRNVARQERQVGHDVAHVGPVAGERGAVHAAPEAVVHAVLDRLDRVRPGSVLRIAREHAHPRPARAASGVEVAAGTALPVAG